MAELNYQTVSVAPEPGTFVLLGAGLVACLVFPKSWRSVYENQAHDKTSIDPKITFL